MKLHWIIDADINAEHHPDLAKIIRSLGHKVTPLSVTKEFPKLSSIEGTIPVFHGSFQELRRVKDALPSVSTYGLGDSVLCSHYTSYLPEKWFFNRDASMTTWSKFCRSYRADDWFIRPDSGTKTFTGQVIHRKNFEHEIKLVEDTSNVTPHTIIWTSTSKWIDNEYRFWISNKKVVASTEYSWDKDHICGDVPEIAFQLAKEVADYDWQIDRIYVVDIVVADELAKVLEFNSFSCSGLYQCDSEALFKAVSDDIIAEWDED